MKLPSRLPYELIIVAGLLLGSCKPAWESKLDYADVNARNALARINSLEGRVSDLEHRLR